ncbi:MAG: aldehyde-activating protein [Croceibacterium sp.]
MTVTVPGRPEYMNSCDCSACFKLGGLTGYFRPDEVTVEGETKTFVRSDIPAWIAFVFCPTCCAEVGWTSLEPLDPPRMGVSMRLFEPDDLVGIPIRFPNGRDWNDEDERPAPRHAEVPFARDAPF